MSQNDPWKGTALRNAMQEEPVNAGHRFEVATLDTNYYADEVRIDPLTGYPAWWVDCGEYRLSGTRYENAVVKDYRPMPREEFRQLPGLIE